LTFPIRLETGTNVPPAHFVRSDKDNMCRKKKFLVFIIKKIKKVKFCLDLYKHALQVSAVLAEKKGVRH
jgi:hypothetical protein